MNKSLGNAIAGFNSIAPCTIGSGTTEATVEGTGVDRRGYESAVFVFHNAQPTGTPTGVTISYYIEESADNSTFTAVASPAEGHHHITNSATLTEVSCELESLDRYVRACMQCLFQGGSGPAVAVSAAVILGMKNILPAS